MPYEYKLLANRDHDKLNEQVNQHLKDGWELWGNPFSHPAPCQEYDRFFCQAVVKFIPKDDHILRDLARQLTDKPAAGYTVGTPETVSLPRPDIRPAPAPADFAQLAQAIAASALWLRPADLEIPLTTLDFAELAHRIDAVAPPLLAHPSEWLR